MTSYTLTLKINEFNKASVKAFQETALILGREFTRVITEPRYWKAFDDVRDIVDLGQLRSSQRVVFNNPTTALFSWNTEYAVYVHEGYTLRNGTVVQGRPWTQIAIQEFDLQSQFAEAYRSSLRAEGIF